MQRPQPSLTQISTYLKREKTFFLEYEIIRLLIASLKGAAFAQLSNTEKDNLIKLYRRLSPLMVNLPLFELLNYMLWNDESAPLQLRDKTKFFNMVSSWIVEFELNIVRVEGSLQSQYKFLRQFFEKETSSTFQRVILFEEIVDDLHDLVEGVFWDSGKPNSYVISKQDLIEILKFLSLLVYSHTVFLGQKGQFRNSIMQQMLEFCFRYRNFMINAFDFILKAPEINMQAQAGNQSPLRKSQQNTNKVIRSLLDESQQMELTQIILLFLQRPDLTSQQVIETIKSVMLHTSKPVRYAMILEYVHFYDYLQKVNNAEVLEALEDIVYFRELVIGSNQINEAGLTVQALGTAFNQIEVPPGKKERIYLSHEREYGSYSVLQMEVLLESGNITIVIWKIEAAKETEYWRENKTEDRRVEIILNKQGLYALEFNNQYSWVKPKRISYSIVQYCQEHEHRLV